MRHVFSCAGRLNSEARTNYYVPYVVLLRKKVVTCNTCIHQTGKLSFILTSGVARMNKLRGHSMGTLSAYV